MGSHLWKLLFGLIATLFLLPISAKASEMISYKKIKDVPVEKWEQLANKKIYFGHQSVGFNIMDGMETVLSLHPTIKLSIVESQRNAFTSKGVFAHFKVGQNTKPFTKIDDFIDVISSLEKAPDVAFFKFCYVDAPDNLSVERLFEQYKTKIETLKKANQDVTIIHFTMPLKTRQLTWKTKLKMLIGKDPWGLAENIKRNTYNKLLLREYSNREPVFDIAAFEATLENGSTASFEYKGESYLCMQDAYSSDGGHLNTTGARMIAEQLLIFLTDNL